MTDILRCLFVDDLPGDLTHFRFPIETAWNSLGTGFTLAFTDKTSFQEGLTEIRQNGEQYDLFILDYNFPVSGSKSKKVYPIGQQLVDAAKTVKRAAIIVITADSAAKADALRHGAHAAVLKDDVQYGGTDLLAPELAKATNRLNLQPTQANTIVQIAGGRVALTEVVERVGRGHIQIILQRLNHQPLTSAMLSYIAPGFSGAAVLRADCQFTGATKKLLLKVSRDSAKLADEIQNIPDAGQFPAGSFLRCEAEGPHSSGGWHGIQAIFDEDAVTLHEKITSDTIENDSISQLAHHLKGAGATTRRKDDEGILRSFDALLTASRRARAEVALGELQPLVGRHCAEKDIARVSEIITNGAHVHDIADKHVPSGTWFHITHGDLHSRNILVTSFGVPRLIDASEVARRIWCSDIARLLVDVFLSAWSHGVDAYDWKLMPTWEDAARALIRGEGWAGPCSRTRAWDVASRLRTEIFSIYPDVEPQRLWEFVFAFGVECIRSMYRADLPAPKRVLAVVAAEQALRFAKERFEAAGITAL